MATLKFRESGGISGQIRGCELDVASLPKNIALSLTSLAENDVQSGRKASAARDALQYEVEYEDKGKVKRLSLNEATMPDAARALIDYLNSKSAWRMPE